MIGTLDIKVNAAHPNMPLAPLVAFVDSPSSVRLINVPKRIGTWDITAVQITAHMPDTANHSADCVLTGGCWVGTLDGSSTAGTSLAGFVVTADGIDENGGAVSGYVLGCGDIRIITREQSITPTAVIYRGDRGLPGANGTTPTIGANGHWYIGSTDTGVVARGTDGADGEDGSDGVTPHIGSNGNWFIGNTDTGVHAQGEQGAPGSSSWADITNKPTTLAGYGITDAALASSVPSVVSPSSSAAEGAAASAKATGTALEGKLDKSGGNVSGNLSVAGNVSITGQHSLTIFTRQINDGVANTWAFPYETGTVALTSDIKTKTSELTNDSGFVTADEVSAPDAHLEVSNENLKVIGENDSTLWQSAGAVRYTKATTEAVALLDMTVNPYTLSAASGTTFSMPSASVAGKIRDFILDITNPLSSEATIQLAGDETTYKFVGVGGVSVTDCLKFAAGESAIVSFTERAIAVNGKVSFVVSKRVVA